MYKALKNISNFIEGNVKMLGDNFGLLPNYQKEQILYRANICKDDCVRNGFCKECGCSVPGKLYVNTSCNNGERFPDIMNESDWDKFKQTNNIKIDDILH